MVPTSLPDLPKPSRTLRKKLKSSGLEPEMFKKHSGNFPFGFKNQGFWFFLRVLEGLGRSGGLVGTISIYTGTCQYPG